MRSTIFQSLDKRGDCKAKITERESPSKVKSGREKETASEAASLAARASPKVGSQVGLRITLYPQTIIWCFTDKLKAQPFWVLVLFTLGSFSVLKFALAFLNWVYVNFLRPAKNLKKYGYWALVTGPTDGIGKGFAFQLACQGLNLILVGRNPGKLKDVSDSIQAKYEFGLYPVLRKIWQSGEGGLIF